MALLDAHLGSILIALALLAVVLGIAAQVLAARLLLRAGQASNDPVFRRSHSVRPARVGRGRLRLAA
jgi:hypothetical protein